MKGTIMMYIIGAEEQRKAFEDAHAIPYYRYAEYTDGNTAHYYNPDDDKACAYIDLADGESFTLQIFNGEIGGIEKELYFTSYDAMMGVYLRIR